MKKCPKCGVSLVDDALFCNNCGENLTNPSTNDKETVDELEKLAAANDVPFDLVRNIILSVYQNKNFSNQRIMKDAMERLLNQQWLHHEILKEIEDENK